MPATGNNSDKRKSLSILIDRDGLSFYDGISKAFSTYALYEGCRAEQIAGILTDISENTSTIYPKANIIVNTGRFAVIPASLYDPAQNETYLKTKDIFFDGGRDTLVVSDYRDMVFVMAVESVIADPAERSISGAVFMHPLLASLLMYEKESANCDGSLLTAHLFKNSVSLTLHREGRLLFGEMFRMENRYDLLFYIDRLSGFYPSEKKRTTVAGCLDPETVAGLYEYDPSIRIEGIRAYDRL